ncbi:PREDICTED: uncharacterized protein LOC105453906 [Wasmannia auropunctata]|uniref:uncharacterized protein LOC105453906 n=1 Tax=Wasmannia auropunctata TaxID=64793 RepID=UPI0005ED9365|nr:PREDICTED: uncharacterized protein LOC105453906 [Wasmannia auropunctata]
MATQFEQKRRIIALAIIASDKLLMDVMMDIDSKESDNSDNEEIAEMELRRRINVLGRQFDPRDLRYAANHTLDLFNEVATIARPPLEPPGGRPPIPSTGYIVSIFKVFEGDDGLKFEQNWLYWTELTGTMRNSGQVSFSGNRTSGTYTPLVVSGNSPPRGEPISLATLDRDCFIIPLASLERFLPAGVPHAPVADKKRPGSPLSVLEVEDPKQCVLAHFMTPLEPLDPLMESPVSRPLVLQRDTAAELVAEIAPSASQSILLTNMEKNTDFPFIMYYLINKQSTGPVDFYNEVQCAALRKFDPRDLRYAANHTLDLASKPPSTINL